MAAATRPNLNTVIDTLFADNGNRAITAANARTVCRAIVESCLVLLSDDYVDVTELNAAIAALVGSAAPGYDTLGELQTIIDNNATARYTKTEMQTSGQSQLHWNNLTNVPSIISYTRVTTAVQLIDSLIGSAEAITELQIASLPIGSYLLELNFAASFTDVANFRLFVSGPATFTTSFLTQKIATNGDITFENRTDALVQDSDAIASAHTKFYKVVGKFTTTSVGLLNFTIGKFDGTIVDFNLLENATLIVRPL